MADAKPPKWADRFLQWYCNPDLLEEIQGDIYELFYSRLDQKGTRLARRSFIWDVFRFFRWSNIKRSKSQNFIINNTIMINNYIKTGYRSLLKDKITSAINIVGLALAIGCAVTCYVFVEYFVTRDNFHENKANIYQVLNNANTNGEEQLWSNVPILLGPELREEVSFLDKMTRIEYASGNMKYNERVFNEAIWFVDPAFNEIFDFPIAFGSKQALYNKEQIFLSRAIATKYFENEDPTGEQVSIKYTNGTVQSYFVGGVYEAYPNNASFVPPVLISIENFFDARFQENYGWDYRTNALFVSLKPGHNASELSDFFPERVTLQNQADPDFQTLAFTVMGLSDASKKNYLIRGSVTGGGTRLAR